MAERDDSLEAGLRAVFRRRDAGRDESVIDRVGAPRSVLLRDESGDPSPVLRRSDESVADPRYQVLGEIARGGVGVVYKSRDCDLARDVALKVLRKEFADNTDVLDRFVEEAQIGGQLQHPGIVPVYGLGLQDDGRPYFAMKLIKGRTLSSLLAESDAAGRRAYVGVFEQVCQTVAYAHARGVLHRDLKPSNVMVGAFGEVQVVDWGFAKVLSGEERTDGDVAAAPPPEQTVIATVRSGEGSSGGHSQAGSVMGTPAYMPPEQALGQVDDLDERADVFSLGAILCEILTGKPPYVGEARDLLVMAAQGRLEGARERLDACGAEPELVALSLCCLAPLRSERPRDAGEASRAVAEQLAAAEQRAREAELASAAARAAREEQRARLAQQEAEAKAEQARAAEEDRRTAREQARRKEELQRAAWERAGRRRTLVLAALVLVAVGGALAGLLSVQASRAAEEREVENAVSRALRQAIELEGADKWSEAAAAAGGAVKLAADASSETRARAEAVRVRVVARHRKAALRREREARDTVLIADLELAQAMDQDDETVDAAFAAAFEKRGLDLSAVDAGAAQIKASTRPVEIAAYVDNWAQTRRELKLEGWQRLFAITKKADPDPVRNRMRDLLVAGREKELRALGPELLKSGAPVRTHTLYAFMLFKASDQLAVVAHLRPVCLAHPDSHTVNRMLGLALLTGDPPRPAEALGCLVSALALQPDSVQARLRVANALSQVGRAVEAMAICRGVLEKHPKLAGAHSQLGGAAVLAGDLETARQAYRTAMELSPDSWVRCNFGWMEAMAGRFEEARDHFQRALESSKLARFHRIYAYQKLGMLHNVLGNYEGALDATRSALELNPREIDVLLEHGRAQSFLGFGKEAEKTLLRALSFAGDHARTHEALGQHYRKPENYDWKRARSHLERAAELEPQRARALATLALSHLNRGDVASARETARAAWRRDASDATAWYALVAVHRTAGEHERALEFARKARTLAQARQPRIRDSLANLTAEVLSDLGRWQEAYDHLVAEGLPDSPETLGSQGAFLSRLGRFREALRRTEQALAVSASLSRGDELTLSELHREHLEWNRRTLDLAVKVGARRDPRNDDEALALALRAADTGRDTDATALFRRVLAGRPANRRRVLQSAVGSAVLAGDYTQGLAWARELLVHWRERLDQGDALERNWLRRTMLARKRANWARPLRDPAKLAELPDNARVSWVLFWNEVDELLASSLERDQD